MSREPLARDVRRHVAVFDAEGAFLPTDEDRDQLAASGVLVSLADDIDALPPVPVTCAVAFATFRADLPPAEWEREVRSSWDDLFALLPRVANPSTLLVVALLDDDSRRSRRSLSSALSPLFVEMTSEAARAFGLDVTVNALVLPTTVDRDLIRRRVLRFSSTRTTLQSGVILHLDDLIEDEIAGALASGVV